MQPFYTLPKIRFFFFSTLCGSRFGIELANPRPDTSACAEDLTLSEGFHWESVPHGPPDARQTGSPPQPQDTTQSESPSDARSDAQVCEPLEPPAQTVKAVAVKVETNLENQNGDLRDHSRARKRKEEEEVVIVSKMYCC